MRKFLKTKKYYHLINHGPCIMVTSGDFTLYPKKPHSINIAPIAWTTPLNDDPPLVIACIDSSSYTSKLILKYRQFVINIIGKNTMRDLIYCGKVSGSDTDKFSKTKLKPVKSKTIKPPYIKESIGHIECSLYYRKEFEGVNLFVGSVKYCEVDEKYYDGNLISEKAKTPHHLGSRIFFFSGRRIKVGE